MVLRFFQELRADNAAEQLKAMVSNKATVVRGGAESETPLGLLVPGDIIRLAAGDMVPADARVPVAKDLFLNQAALTGEALPVERKADDARVQSSCLVHGLQSPLAANSGRSLKVVRDVAPDHRLILLFGGGGGYYYGRGAGWRGPHYGGGLLTLVLIIVLIVWLTGGMGGGMMLR